MELQAGCRIFVLKNSQFGRREGRERGGAENASKVGAEIAVGVMGGGEGSVSCGEGSCVAGVGGRGGCGGEGG